MRRLVVSLMAAGAGALSLLGMAAMSLSAYLYDPVMILAVGGLWCLCGLFSNRWMLATAQEHGGEVKSLWLWSLLGCWAWPMGVVCGLALRLAPPQGIKISDDSPDKG